MEDAKYGSRKFMLVLVSILIVVINRGLGLNLNDDDLNKVILIVMGYGAIQGTADILKFFKEKKEGVKDESKTPQ